MRSDLPRGEVTFLFTDIEGSTRLLHELGPDGYAQALAEHRRIIRGACAAHGGVEVDTQGDAFFVAFGAPAEAVLAAGELTDALAAGTIHVRIGIHTGHPTLTDEGYVGEDVHLAARVGASAHGGQVVVTSATYGRLATDAGLHELGEHRLKDIVDPVPLFQLGDGRFPPLRTVSNSNLPRPASSFVGRQDDVEGVLELVRTGARLVTLTGPGGTGKTRLALEAASQALPSFPGGVFWVALAPLRDPSLVTTTIAQALGAKVSLVEHIGQRRMLLLLDNLEQVVESAPALGSLLTACPGLRILVTSRELLRVQGEVEYRVPPLAPADAVLLFGQRSGLAPTREIVELCARLDHLPLAVELAAARSRAMSPAQILDRLSSRLDLLRGGRDADPRQVTLRATIDWSYDLLSTEEQQLFRRLAVFAGGASLDAAEAVVDADLDVLQSVVEKSLVRYTGDRYRMLESIRDYAAERLSGTAEAEAIRERHARWIAALVELAEPRLEAGDQDIWLDRLTEERDDIRAALTWSIAREDAQLAVTIAGRAAPFWWIKGDWSEGRTWLAAALALHGAGDLRRARALEGAANLDVRLGNYEQAIPPAEESLAISRRIGDARGIARAQRILGLIAWWRGDVAATRGLMDECASAARAAGDPWALSMALNNLGYLALEDGALEPAADRFLEAVQLAQAHGDHRSEAFFLENLALALLGQGATVAAAERLAASLRFAHRLGFLEVVATDLIGAAAIGVAHDRPDTAARLLGAADEVVRRTGGGLDSVESRLRETTAMDIRRLAGAAAFEAGLASGRTEDPDVAVALALEVLAEGPTTGNIRGGD